MPLSPSDTPSDPTAATTTATTVRSDVPIAVAGEMPAPGDRVHSRNAPGKRRAGAKEPGADRVGNRVTGQAPENGPVVSGSAAPSRPGVGDAHAGGTTATDAARLDAPESLGLDALRRRLIDPIMLLLAAPLALTHLLPLQRALATDTVGWPVSVRFGCVAGIFTLILLRHRIAYRLKVRLFLLFLWGVLGLSVLSIGPVANSKTYFVLLVLLGMLFLPRRDAWINIGLGTLILSAIGLGAVSGHIEFAVDLERHARSAAAWINTVFGFVVYSGICAFITLRLMESLNRSVEQLQARTRALDETSARLRETLERQHAVFNNAAAGIALLDGDRRFALVNPTLAEMLGYTPEQLQGRSTRLIHLDEHAYDEVVGRFYLPLRRRSAWAEDIQLRCRDGSTLWTHASLGMLHSGEPAAGTVLVLVNIEARKRAEQALAAALAQAEEANQAKSRLLAAVSHELRTPLHVILGSLSVLRGNPCETMLEPETAGVLDSMEAGGRRLLGMIDDLIDMGRLEQGTELSLHPAPLRLAELLEDCLAAVATLAEVKWLGLRLRLDADAPQWINADRRRLAQILGNLLSNAVKYTEEGEIELRARLRVLKSSASSPRAQCADAAAQRASLCISVRDTGPGIAPSERKRLFQPFAQGRHEATARGSGLGLAIARGLARRMGGDIRVTSRPGVGSRFELCLPLAAIEVDPDLLDRGASPPAAASSSAPRFGTPALPPKLAAALRQLVLAQGIDPDKPDPSNPQALSDLAAGIAALAHAWGHAGLLDWAIAFEHDLASAQIPARQRAPRALAELIPAPPPAADLAQLRAAALQGNVGALERWCARLDARPEYRGFVARVRLLAKDFEHARIIALADAFLGSTSA